MQDRQEQTIEWALNVRSFLERHQLRIDGAELAPATQQLDDLLATLADQAVEQGGETLQAETQTRERRRLRRVLRERHMLRIVRAASTFVPRPASTAASASSGPGSQGSSASSGAPGVAGSPADAEVEKPAFAMPQRYLSDQALAQYALSLGVAAEPLATQFVACGLAPDFVARLRTAADALIACGVVRSQHLRTRRGLGEGMDKTAARTRRVIRLLDALVRPEVAGDPRLAGEWEKAVRRPRSSGGGAREQGAGTGPAPQTPSSTLPSSAASATAPAVVEPQHAA